MSKAIRANTVTLTGQLIAALTGINWPAFSVIVITGASSGIGRATAPEQED
jgi:NADP-dependent 3-hydroxy acid dehydrogenase YdfG